MTGLDAAIATVPPGRWAVAASGGADSTALACLMATRKDCEIALVHLDHQLRGEESDRDADFVGQLGERLRVPADFTTLSDLSNGSPPARGGGAEQNSSARYRAARFAFFAEVVGRRGLDGVLLAHHADDQAETVLLQLLRGRGLPFLGGMRAVQTINDLPVHRPLLGVRREVLRDYLKSIGQSWREDSSNASTKYRRNVVRHWLVGSRVSGGWHRLVLQPESSALPPVEHRLDNQPVPPRDDLVPSLCRLADASQRWQVKLDADAPQLAESFLCDALRISQPLAEHAARRWLVARGAPPDRVSPAICRRLIAQAIEVSQSPRQHYPGGLLVRRRQKRIDVLPSPPVQSRQTHGQEIARTEEL